MRRSTTTNPLPLEVAIQDHHIIIRVSNREAVVLSASEQGLLEVALPNTELIDLRDEPRVGNLGVLHVTARYRDPLEEGMLKYKKTVAKAGMVIEVKPEPTKRVVARKGGHAGSNSSLETIADTVKWHVVNEIIASYVEKPVQTPAETVAITKALAEKHKQSLYQIAGVRAALTKGHYGRKSDLMARYRKYGHV